MRDTQRKRKRERTKRIKFKLNICEKKNVYSIKCLAQKKMQTETFTLKQNFKKI